MFFPVALGGTIPRKAAEGLMHTSSVWKLKRKKKKKNLVLCHHAEAAQKQKSSQDSENL